MSRLAEGSVDLVVTSPPYNLGISYGKYSDRQDRRSYLGWCGEWAGQVRRVLRRDGSFFLNIGAAPSNPMLPHEIVMTLRDLFVLHNTITGSNPSRLTIIIAVALRATHALPAGKRLQPFARLAISSRSIRGDF